MNLFKSITRSRRRRVGALAVLAAFSTAPLFAAEPPISTVTPYDLTPAGNTKVDVPGEVGGTAIFSDYFLQPAGTGVFKPFLDLKSPNNGSIEEAYNSDAKNLDFD